MARKDPRDALRWIIDFESFYRRIGLLGSAFRFSPADFNELEKLIADRQLRFPLSLAWLSDVVRRYEPEAVDLLEMELLAELDGSQVVRWWPDDDSDFLLLLPRLAAISGGTFLPCEMALEIHEVDGGDFLELSCVINGQHRHIYLPKEKYGRHTELLVELNRWIEHTPRRFGKLWDHFVCVDDAQRQELAARGLDPLIPTEWKADPAELLRLAEYFVEIGDREHALAVSTFDPTLAERAPRLAYYEGLAQLASGDATRGWAAIERAVSLGDHDAATRARVHPWAGS